MDCLGFPSGPVAKNLPTKAGDPGDIGMIPGSERSPGEGNGKPGGLQSRGLQRADQTEHTGTLHLTDTFSLNHGGKDPLLPPDTLKGYLY